MKQYSILVLVFLQTALFAQQHPVAYFTKADVAVVKNGLTKEGLLKTSFKDVKQSVDRWIGKDVDVPMPKNPAGGYTHEKHKANYILMFNSGLMYQLTGDTKYALLVKNLLLKYAALNPTLQNHPQATSTSPGRIFWQALNDANWLVYTGLAFDCIYNYLTPIERQLIADGAFKPEVDFFTVNLKDWFNLIHNHAVWACAGVGIVGIATDNKQYLNMALHGTSLDGKSGFLANIDGLFSPDGYYTEGPYYVRYAILPFYLFANALNNQQPSLKVFQRRNNVLQKALVNGLQQTNLNGGFYSYNDALKEKTFVSNEIVEALSIAWKVYGADISLLPVAKQQNRVTLSKGGATVAAMLATAKSVAKFYTYKPISFTDGAKGNEGGVSILRAGIGAQLTSLIYKYTSHGLSHGHFDKLNINLYDGGNEILQDYGAARFIGIEQKYGGRYLPESKNYAAQTIAHNTVVVDETSHFNGKEEVSQMYHPEKLFSNSANQKIQVVSAIDEKAYSNVTLHRTLWLLQLPDAEKPLTVDFFRLLSSKQHQYDLPFQYLGTVINTSFKYQAFTNNQTTLGTKNGYQFLWKEASAKASNGLTQFTFLNNSAYYTISSYTDDSTNLYFTRLGANDPNFNLRRDPAYIIRKKGTNQTFVNVVEIHGKYDTNNEVSVSAYPKIEAITILRDDADYLVAQIKINGKLLLVAQANKNVAINAAHALKLNGSNVHWIGPYTAIYNNQNLQ
ncbi:MAG: heparinase II/III family protein [Flavobacterium sp.]|nr:heparinase II/III family protein [Flavobacterium sp.]